MPGPSTLLALPILCGKETHYRKMLASSLHSLGCLALALLLLLGLERGLQRQDRNVLGSVRSVVGCEPISEAYPSWYTARVPIQPSGRQIIWIPILRTASSAFTSASSMLLSLSRACRVLLVMRSTPEGTNSTVPLNCRWGWGGGPCG